MTLIWHPSEHVEDYAWNWQLQRTDKVVLLATRLFHLRWVEKSCREQDDYRLNWNPFPLLCKQLLQQIAMDELDPTIEWICKNQFHSLIATASHIKAFSFPRTMQRKVDLQFAYCTSAKSKEKSFFSIPQFQAFACTLLYRTTRNPRRRLLLARPPGGWLASLAPTPGAHPPLTHLDFNHWN